MSRRIVDVVPILRPRPPSEGLGSPPMKTFEIHGQFEAENIDDAFEKLGRHFTALANGDDPDVFDAPLKLDIVPAGSG